MTPTELLNHLRLCTLEEIRGKLERLQTNYPEQFDVVSDFMRSCIPKR